MDAPRVAEWAGLSVAVLLRIYAKCLDGQDDAVRKRIQATLQIANPDDEYQP